MGAGASTNRERNEVDRDDFIFSSTIGVGGFSRVLSTMHVPSKTWMALKETSIKGVAKHKKGLRMLAAEVQILAELSSQDTQPSFIVSLHFAFRDSQKCYMVLDLHQGGDLRYHIRTKKLFPERAVAFYAICLASALHHVHSKGILHRDVKPENVILDAEGFPYLTDFGVSTISSTEKELICNSSSGTRQYLAPEVFTRTHRHGVEADFWSLGVMLYELIYGRRPFNKHCPLDMIHFHEDLHCMNINLSSTSFKFSKQQSDLKSTSKDFLSEPEVVGVANLPCIRHDIEDKNIFVNKQRTDEKQHWTHVAITIRDNVTLAEKIDFLRRCAVQDSLLEEKDNSLSKHSIRNSTAQFPVRQSLPGYLRVSMAKYAQNSKRVSPACIGMLEGLLDVRLWSRLGAGYNYHRFKNHAWFDQCQLIWKDVLNRKVAPLFVPNVTKVTRELAFKHERHKVVELTALDCTTTMRERNYNHLTSKLPTLDKNILSNFYFVAPQYRTDTASDNKKENMSVESTGSNLTNSAYTTSAAAPLLSCQSE